MIDNRYLYPVARTKAQELELLNKSTVERLLSSNDVVEALKILSETAYAPLLADLGEAVNIEVLIEKMIKKTKAFIDEVSPDPLITGAFFLKYDVHNVKVLLKNAQLGINTHDLLSGAGNIPLNQLLQCVQNLDASFFRGALKDCVQLLFHENNDADRIDRDLDQALYETMLEYAKSEYMREIINTQIDLINLRTLFRMKQIGHDIAKFEKSIIKNGSLEPQFLMKVYEEPLTTLPAKLMRFGYSGLIEKSIGDTAFYEKYAEDFLFEKVKCAKYYAFGIEPLIGFILAKEHETQILRMILVCKKNHVSNEVIRKRVGEVYV